MTLTSDLMIPRQIADRVAVVAGIFRTGPYEGKFYTRRVRELLRRVAAGVD